MATSAEPRKGITDEQQQELDECFARARKAQGKDGTILVVEEGDSMPNHEPPPSTALGTRTTGD